MEYRAVGNRIAVDLNTLGLPISHHEALRILYDKGFKIIEVDLISLARQCIGRSRYCRGVRPSEAPAIIDCSSFVKWLYGMRGIWLPRRSIQQRELGEAVGLDKLIAGDLIFVSGWVNYYDDDPANGVGHVGIATGDNTVIHAANKKVNVVESALDKFVGKNKFRGARRYVPKDQEIITLEFPAERELEIVDDIKWIILQTLQ